MSQPRDTSQPHDPRLPPDWNAVGASRPPVPEPAQPGRVGSGAPGAGDAGAPRAHDAGTAAAATTPHAPGDQPPTWAPSFYAEPPPAPAAETVQPAYASAPPPTPVATEPVTNRSNAARWAVALGATAIVLVAGLAILLFARQGTTSTAAAPGYLAPNTLAYGEFRLDLPGDQRENLGRFLSHFPGFADSSTLEAKLDDVFDRLFGGASGGEYTYTDDVKPWFGGQVAFGLPAPAGDEAASAPPIVIVTVKDRAAAQAVLDELRADASDASWVSRDHAGTTIWSSQLESEEAGVDGFHYALTDDALLFGGRLADVEGALDRKARGGDNLGGSNDFNSALAGLRDDRLATVWLNTSFIKAAAIEQLEERGVTAGADTFRSFLEKMPNRVVVQAFFEPDRFVAETRTDAPGGMPAGKASELADNAPAESLVFLEWRDAGTGLAELVRTLKEDPQLQEAAPQLTQVEAFLGGSLEGFFDWMGDIAIVGGLDGEQPNVALLATARNEEAGRQRLAQLAALLQFAGQLGIEVNSEDIGGTTITTIVLPSSLGTGLGAPLPTDEIPERVALSYGFRNGAFVIAGSPAEAARLLNLPRERSLAATERFSAAVEAAGGEQNSGISYVDVAGLRGAIEGFLPADQREMYTREIQPYLEPLDLLVSLRFSEGDDAVQRSIITVK